MKYKPVLFGIIAAIAGLLFIMQWFGATLPSANHGSTRGTIGQAGQITPAPGFTLPRLDGGTISLAEFVGKKPVILDFWASWCHNCQRSMPKLNRWYQKYNNDVEVIGINLQENSHVAQQFVDSRDITFPVALDASGVVSQQYGIQYTNTHFLIDISGNISGFIPGDLRESDIQNLIAGSQ